MSHAGRLLVATPLIADPSFERTVVLLLAHGTEGSFGVILNRPSATPIDDLVPGWADEACAPAVLFIGGPVGRDAVVGLARCAGGEGPGFEAVLGDCGTVDLHAVPQPGAAPWTELRLYAGSAGWGAGQLEDEVAEGAWWLLDACPQDVATTDPANLWREVLRRQHGEVAWFANHPDDPSAN